MHADFQPCAYIMASARHGTLYTGVTSHLIQRICQHRDGGFGGFPDRCGVKTLVLFELAAQTRHRENRLIAGGVSSHIGAIIH